MSQRRVPKPVPQRIALVTGKRSVSIPHVVIVGGGFGGLYTAKRLKYRPVRVTLIDRRNHHLFQPLLYQVATAALSPEVRTGTPVTAIAPDVVVLSKERIATYTALWAAGVTASPLARTLGVPLDRAGRVLVEPDLTIKEHPEVFAIGDLAALVDPGTSQPLPGVATVAIQQGRATADNLWRACRGQPLVPFRYKERGSMATIGRARAVADLGRLQFTGFVAWVLWLVVHLYFLIGFEDRLLVMLQWAWAYLTRQRGARLITTSRRRRSGSAVAQAPTKTRGQKAESARTDKAAVGEQ